MISRKPLYVQQPLSYVFLGVTPGTFDKFVQMAGTPAGQDESTPGFPDPEQMQRLLALAEEFGVKILVSPDLRTRN